MPRDNVTRDTQYLLDILESGKVAVGYVSSKSWSDFQRDTQCQDAIIRRLEIIGEAANRVSSDKQSELSELPWRAMIGMRNLMIHRYDAIDFKIVWDTVQRDLPTIIAQIEGIVFVRGE